MLAKAWGVLLDFDLLHTTNDFNFGAVIQIACFSALEPDHFAIIFCHGYILLN